MSDRQNAKDGASQKINLFGKSRLELQEFFRGISEPSYRGNQMFGWIYKKQAHDFGQITDFTKTLRERLSESAEIRLPEVITQDISVYDGTTKFLLELEDGNRIETVLIPTEKSPEDMGSERRTVCVSTQVGCALDCVFCATGAMKFVRNLTSGEIVAQIVVAQRSGKKRITNVVFMGMGEPLLNHEGVTQAIEIITDDSSMNIRAKGITVSTAGITEGIKSLAEERIKFRLAISLHSLDENVRNELMPIGKKYRLDGLLEAAAQFARKRRDRITIEYILFGGVNDGDEDITRLVKLSKRLPLKINLLRYHPLGHLAKLGLQIDPSTLKLRPSDRIDLFAARLRDEGITVFVRSNAGEDIDGACGQLAAKNTKHHIKARAAI